MHLAQVWGLEQLAKSRAAELRRGQGARHAPAWEQCAAELRQARLAMLSALEAETGRGEYRNPGSDLGPNGGRW